MRLEGDPLFPVFVCFFRQVLGLGGFGVVLGSGVGESMGLGGLVLAVCGVLWGLGGLAFDAIGVLLCERDSE